MARPHDQEAVPPSIKINQPSNGDNNLPTSLPVQGDVGPPTATVRVDFRVIGTPTFTSGPTTTASGGSWQVSLSLSPNTNYDLQAVNVSAGPTHLITVTTA